MHISLTDELDAYVRAKVEEGLYGNASEVIRDSLRMMIRMERETSLYDEWVRAKLEVAQKELDRGEERPLDMDALIERLNTEKK